MKGKKCANTFRGISKPVKQAWSLFIDIYVEWWTTITKFFENRFTLIFFTQHKWQQKNYKNINQDRFLLKCSLNLVSIIEDEFFFKSWGVKRDEIIFKKGLSPSSKAVHWPVWLLNNPTQHPFQRIWNSPLLNKKFVPTGQASKLQCLLSSVRQFSVDEHWRLRVLLPQPPHCWVHSSCQTDHGPHAHSK